MWYFTGKGDQGASNLYDGRRISKSDLILELIGTLDEANAHLGLAISLCKTPDLKADMREIQDHLSGLMGYIAGVKKVKFEEDSNPISTTEWLEKMMNNYGKSIRNPRAFVNAGETTLGAAIDISRTIIRRAERIAVRYFEVCEGDWKEILTYLNRLSSFLYILRITADPPEN